MIGVLPVEIRDFPSLSELSEFLDREITWYETLFKEYSERLGSLLREQGFSSEEIEKILREGGLTRQTSGKKGKKGKKSSSEGWFSFKGLLFSADKQGKAEILFESVDKIEETIKRMKEARTLIEDLQKTGFGHGLAYSVYLVDGVPEKIFVQKAENATRKYKLELFLSTSMKLAASPTDKKAEKDSGDEEEEKPGGEEAISDEDEEENRREEDAEKTGKENRSENSSDE